MDGWGEPPAKALRDHHRGYARTRQRILIADRMLLIDKVKIVALGAVDGHRVAPREGCHLHLFQRAKIPSGSKLKGVEILVERCVAGRASKTSPIIVTYAGRTARNA